MSTSDHRPTVLVLGAGAGYAIGFPTAAELRELIIRPPGPNGDGRFARMLMPWNYNSPERDRIAWGHMSATEYFCHRYLLNPVFGMLQLEHMRRAFRDSNLYSIDSWLRTERGSEYADTARQAIASTLLACEKMIEPSGGWYSSFLNRLFNHEKVERLSIITFNYDRSLRHFLYTSAKHWFSKENTAWDFAHRIEILPVYGDLGPLNGEKPVSYGCLKNHQVAANNIQLMRPHTEAPAKVQQRIREAEHLYFMGFAFDRLNLDALGITMENRISSNARVYGTTFNLAAETLQYFRRCVDSFDGGRFPSMKCDEFFESVVNLRLS